MQFSSICSIHFQTTIMILEKMCLKVTLVQFGPGTYVLRTDSLVEIFNKMRFCLLSSEYVFFTQVNENNSCPSYNSKS